MRWPRTHRSSSSAVADAVAAAKTCEALGPGSCSTASSRNRRGSTPMSDPLIKEVRSWTCRVPLSRPIVMGDIRFEYREYIVVEIVTQGGVTGIGYGMTRNGPVQAIVERTLRPLLIGADATMTEQHWERLYYTNLPMGQRGIFMRALSAVDIALWDLKAKFAGMPLWKLLGGFRDRVPALVAGGYAGANVTPRDLEREVADYVDH